MAKLDKNFFDLKDLARTEWRELVREAQDESGIHFDLENDDAVSQKNITVDTPEDRFEGRDGKVFDEKARFHCELCQAGGDWQQGTYYFRCQGYEGRFAGRKRFVLIPSKAEGNIHLVSEGKKSGPQDSGKDLKRDFDAEAKLCWDSLPGMLGKWLKVKRAQVKKMSMVMRVAADTELVYRKVPMVGKLTLKQKDGDYGILRVPEAFKKAVYDAIWEEGMQYDDLHDKHEAHISVFDDVEMKELRKKGKIPEDGKEFKFDIKSVEMVEPDGWPEMEKVWFVTVDSPELESLRKKYGFSALMNGDHKFHITVAVKPRKSKVARIVKRVAAFELLRDYSSYLGRVREALRGLPYEEKVLSSSEYGDVILFQSLVSVGKKLLVLSGQHGEEIAGPWSVLAGMKKFRSFLESNSVSFIPVCNLFGFTSGIRDGVGGEKTNWAIEDGLPRLDSGVEIRTLIDNVDLLASLAADGSINMHEDAKLYGEGDKAVGIYMYVLGDKDRVSSMLLAGSRYIPLRPDGNYDEQEVSYRQEGGVVWNVNDGSFDQLLFENGVPLVVVTETPIIDGVSFDSRVSAGVAMMGEFLSVLTREPKTAGIVDRIVASHRLV